jgi:endonuclease-3
MKKKERFEHIINYFKTNQPIAETELHYENPFQLLIAVILSAQCTDKRINMVTPDLFKAFPTPQKLAQAEFDEVFHYIKSVSYPSNKSKHLIGMAQMLVNDFDGKVPETTEMLTKLPGVGRKTANVITSVVYHQPSMAVDTHVFRVSNRLGLTVNSKTPLQTEKELIKYIPQEYVAIAHHWLILHGRYICTARSPKCTECKLAEYCKWFAKTNKKPIE